MGLLISDAWAQQPAAGSSSGPGIELLVMIGIFFLIMYFLVIRPQSKRSKEHKALLVSLSKGDEVITNGGLLGKVARIHESLIDLEIHKDVIVKVQKQSISSVIPKGTISNSS